jgi:hypothetical protein
VSVRARPVMVRLLERVTVDSNGCWLWSGSTIKGYGQIWVGRKADKTWRRDYTHRVAYEQFRSPIPEGLQLDHLCRVRNCANPWHLEAVSLGENFRRGQHPNMVARRTNTCKRGHSLKDAYVDRAGGRSCRKCGAERARATRAREASKC